MRKNLKFVVASLIVFGVLVACGEKSTDTTEPIPSPSLRYFDTAPQKGPEVRLTIFYPTAGHINILQNLQEKGLFNPKQLLVIGVFHSRERTNYQAAINMAQEKNLTWIKFHKLSQEFSPSQLFETNPLTAEFRTIYEKSDGVIFFGGPDIPPQIYGENTRLLTRITQPWRHNLELSFAFHLLGGFQNQNHAAFMESSPTFPVLGICLGEQTLNVATGGTMIQDVWDEVYGIKTYEEVIAMPQENWHTNPYARLYPDKNLFGIHLHPIKLLEKGKFVTEFGFKSTDQPFILSSHHQVADKLGKGMTPIATSLDGQVIEAIAHDRYSNVLGIQFHPESPRLYDPDEKQKITPHDQAAVSCLTILENNPPSLEFHKKIWAWFAAQLEAYHNSK